MISAILSIGSKILGSVIGKSVGGGLIDKAGGIVEKFVDQKGSRERAALEADSKALDQFAAESAQKRENRTFWDSFIDGANRLPRPVAFFLTVWIFIWPLWDMLSFQNAMISYQAIPEWVAILVTIVWTFYFGGRMLTKDMKGFKARSPKEIKEMLNSQREIQTLLTSKDPVDKESPTLSTVPQSQVEPLASAAHISEKEYQKDFADTSKPLSLPSIIEWNKRSEKTNG
jgi:hypothetical protein